MKNIKFRVWCRQTETIQLVSKMGFNEGELWYVEDKDYETQPPYFVGNDDWELMQYTGLKDKNGKEIYESDILQDEWGVGRVAWVQEHCAFLILIPSPHGCRYQYLESDGQLKLSEIVGNIYENPSLLEGESSE